MKKFKIDCAVKRETEKAYLVVCYGEPYCNHAMSDRPEIEQWLPKSQITTVQYLDCGNMGYQNPALFEPKDQADIYVSTDIYIPAWLCSKIGWEFCNNHTWILT